jgi:hypothetical protein
MDKGCDRIIANLKNMKKENSLSTLEAVVHCDDMKGQRLGIVTVPVQDGWTDRQTDNRPVPSLGYWSPQHAVLSPDGSEDGRPVHQKTEGRMILVVISVHN